jgi:orotidine-5'-phosphate decarboxylase
MKIGLQAFVACGPSIVCDLVASEHRVFLDLKFHDIPNTAASAVKEAARLGATIANVHASGGGAMLRASAEAAKGFDPRPLVLGVTVLTSLEAGDLAEMGLFNDPAGQAERLARLCKANGLDGVVASPAEISAIRNACGDAFVVLTPGIRGAGDERNDQRRTMAAGEAVAAGADYIVVGRPITAAGSPRDAAARIVDEISAARRP